MTPAERSEQWRTGTGEHLVRRRRVAGLTLAAIGSLGIVALYQLGLIDHVPEPPIPGFDADAVDAAAEAYAILAMPDAVLGIASYAVTLGLVAMSSEERTFARPWLPVALALKVSFDAVVATKLTRDQWTIHRAFCMWCLLAAGATFASVPLVVPEARSAVRSLGQGQRR
jgi:uncharacterized membrane protein